MVGQLFYTAGSIDTLEEFLPPPCYQTNMGCLELQFFENVLLILT